MIIVDYKKPLFTLEFPYNKRELNIVRHLPIREWDKDSRTWRVPQLAAKTLDVLPDDTFWSAAAAKKKEEIEKGLLRLIDYKFATGAEHAWMRPYQVVGSDFLNIAKSALLADSPGLGKTSQSIRAVLEGGRQKVLVLCPATLKWNWAKQFQKHFGIIPLVVEGNAAARALLWAREARFKIANYELLQRDWNVIPKEWDAVIADEAVYLKTHSAKRTKLAKKLKAPCRIGLSGIPLENSLEELHSIMEWVRPEVVPSFFHFKRQFCISDRFGNTIGYKNLDDFHMLTSPFILRRTKEEVLKDLPEKIYEDIPLELDAQAKSAYDLLASQFMKWLRDEDAGKEKTPMNILERTIRLRQFVEHPGIVGFDSIENIKLSWLKEMHRIIDKIVVFTPFATSARLLQKEFKTPYFLEGDVPNKDRIPMIDDFNAAERGILVSTDAGKFGVDMVGASAIVHYGYFYNPGTMLQREDRLHRIGQTQTVHVFRPYVEKTIDVGIRSIYMSRAEQAMNFMDDSLLMSKLKLSKKDFEKLIYGEEWQ